LLNRAGEGKKEGALTTVLVFYRKRGEKGKKCRIGEIKGKKRLIIRGAYLSSALFRGRGGGKRVSQVNYEKDLSK